MKGHTPHNKGRRAREYMTPYKLRKIKKNLEKGRTMDKSYLSEVNSKRVVAIKQGKLKGIFKSSLHAESLTGIKASNIRLVCAGKRKTAGGLQWFHETDGRWVEMSDNEV